MSSDYDAIRAQAQTNLVEFLRAELDAARTYAQAAAASPGRADHFLESKWSARQACESVERFLDQVRDIESRATIEDELAELKRRISKL